MHEWFNLNGDLVESNLSVVFNLCQGTYIVKTTDQSNGCDVEDTLIVWYLLGDIVDLEKLQFILIPYYGDLVHTLICGDL